MSNIAVVYWSGTGNTQAMAEAVARGCGGTLLTADIFTPDQVAGLDAIAFGCPSMGTEQLEEAEFAPMFESVKDSLAGKRLVLFGSYGWGDGEWMRTWEEDCIASGAELVADSVICQDAPDADVLDACENLGKALKG